MKERVTDETTSREPLRVVLIDGTEVVNTGIRGVLAKHGDQVRLVGQVRPDVVVADVITDVHPDVALVVLCGGRECSALALAGELESKHSVPVLVLSEVTDERWLYEALRRGVTGYLLISADGTQLADALVQVAGGARVLDPDLASRIALSAAHASEDGGWPGSHFGLSRRETDVLRLLSDGLSNRRIAEELGVGDETVKTHLRKIYKKLGVQDRTQAVSLALRQGLFPEP